MPGLLDFPALFWYDKGNKSKETEAMKSLDQLSLMKNRITELEKENRQLHETLAYLTHKLFGSSSEKTSALGIEGQMSLFDEAEVFADAKAPEPDLSDVSGYRKKKFKGQREALLKDLWWKRTVSVTSVGIRCPPWAKSLSGQRLRLYLQRCG